MRSGWRTIAASLFALLGVAWMAWAAIPCVEPVTLNHRTSAKDILPLYLGAHALAAGQDPNDPAALRQAYEALELRTQVGGFFSYYPRSASLFAMPVKDVPFERLVRPIRVTILLSLVGAVVAGVLAGAEGADRKLLVGAAASATAFVLMLRVSAPIVRIAQPGPIVALFSGLALLGLARRRDGWAGAAIGLGMALKFAPVLVALGALAGRRWRTGLVAAAVFGGLLLVSLAYFPELSWRRSELWQFLLPDPTPQWEPGLLGLWRARLAIVPLTAIALAWAMWRRASVTAAAALALAGGAVLLAGTRHPHETIQLVPVLGWLAGAAVRPGAGWFGWVLPVGVAIVGVLAGVISPAGNAPTLAFLPFALAAWGACLWRLVRDREG